MVRPAAGVGKKDIQVPPMMGMCLKTPYSIYFWMNIYLLMFIWRACMHPSIQLCLCYLVCFCKCMRGFSLNLLDSISMIVLCLRVYTHLLDSTSKYIFVYYIICYCSIKTYVFMHVLCPWKGGSSSHQSSSRRSRQVASLAVRDGTARHPGCWSQSYIN